MIAQITSFSLSLSLNVCSTADPLLQLVSLQKASGCWDLDVTLADAFGKTEEELTNQKPAQVRDVMNNQTAMTVSSN
jgi:hypothetical protein